MKSMLLPDIRTPNIHINDNSCLYKKYIVKIIKNNQFYCKIELQPTIKDFKHIKEGLKFLYSIIKSYNYDVTIIGLLKRKND